MKLKLILPVEFIPDGSTVMKPTGTKKHTLKKTPLKIYSNSKSPTVINPPEGGAFLMSNDTINAVEMGKELKIVFDVDDSKLEYLLEEFGGDE